MQKTARKPSMDPKQEKLRQNKANWNKEVSTFINDVIHLKKMINGWPSKFYKARSRITDPIPADPGSILGVLAGDFQELAQRGNSIVQEQLDYSKNRRQKQPKQPGVATPTEQAPQQPQPTAPEAPKPDLTKQLSLAASHFEEKYDLVVEGSNPLSRFFTRMVTPTRGFGSATALRRLRMDLLKAAITTYRDLGRLQVHIVASNKESATQAYKEMQKTWNDWTLILRGFNRYITTNPNAGAAPPGDIETPTEKPDDKLEPVAPAPAALPPPAVPANDNAKKQKPLTPEQQLEVTAQAFLKKWLGKARHQVLPKHTSSYRLEIFNLANDARVNINKIMDLLEKGLDVNQLSPLMMDVNRQMTALRLLVRSVHFSEKPGESQPMGMF